MNKALDSLHTRILNSKFAEEVTQEEIEALVEAKNNGWISIDERLPEDNQSIIATFSDGRVYQVNFILFLHENPQYAHDNKIIAWQPLPQPYKEGSE